MGATLVSTGDRIDNDNLKKVGVYGAYNLPIVEWTYEIKAGSTPKPGMHVQPDTGAAGEDDIVTGVDKTPIAFAFTELDKAQIANCDTAYTAGDEIPVIPFCVNVGALLRNVHIADPAANVDAMKPLCTSSGTAGLVKNVTEATLVSSTGTHYYFQTSTLGTNAAAGTFIEDYLRTIAMQRYYIANPSAARQDVVSILHA